MNDREKLLKLILEADDICEATDCVYGDNCKYSKCTWCRHEMTADHLIANGVVVREKGEWVYAHWCEFKCSKCGALSKTEPRGEENFCPNCGADMRAEEQNRAKGENDG